MSDWNFAKRIFFRNNFHHQPQKTRTVSNLSKEKRKNQSNHDFDAFSSLRFVLLLLYALEIIQLLVRIKHIIINSILMKMFVYLGKEAKQMIASLGRWIIFSSSSRLYIDTNWKKLNNCFLEIFFFTYNLLFERL